MLSDNAACALPVTFRNFLDPNVSTANHAGCSLNSTRGFVLLLIGRYGRGWGSETRDPGQSGVLLKALRTKDQKPNSSIFERRQGIQHLASPRSTENRIVLANSS